MPTKTTPAPSATKKQTALAEKLLADKAALADLLKEIAETEAALVKSIGDGNAIEVDGLARIAVTHNTTNVVDFETLLAQKPGWARRVTKKVLDTAKFNGLLQAGAVPDDVKALVTRRETDPFLRVTARPQPAES